MPDLMHDAYVEKRGEYHQRQRADLSGPLQPCPTCSIPMPEAGLPCPPVTSKKRINRRCGSCRTVWSENVDTPSIYRGICPACETAHYSQVHDKWAERDSPHPLFGKIPG